MRTTTPFREQELQSRPTISKKAEPAVLVVEDDPDTQDFMTKALEAEGMKCFAADSVSKAFEILKTEKVTVMVLDWGLDRSGAEVLSVAKALYPGMPVLAISGLPFEVRTDAMVKKADAFLNKPFSATVLTGQVRQLADRMVQAPSIALPQRVEDILPLREVEAIYIRHVLELLAGNKSKAAAALGIHRQTVATVLTDKEVCSTSGRGSSVNDQTSVTPSNLSSSSIDQIE